MFPAEPHFDLQQLDIHEHIAHPGTVEEPRLDRLVRLGVALQQLGVSEKEAFKLLSEYPLDRVEIQISWLPLRKPKKPASLIVTAIREDFEAPAAGMPEPAKESLEEKLKRLVD